MITTARRRRIGGRAFGIIFLLVGLAALAGAIALGLWARGSNINAEAHAYSSARVCTAGQTAGCRQQVSAKVLHVRYEYNTEYHKSGKHSYYTTRTKHTFVTLKLANGRTSQVEDSALNDSYVPPTGAAVTAELWKGKVTKITDKQGKTLDTMNDPATTATNTLVGIIFLAGFGLLFSLIGGITLWLIAIGRAPRQTLGLGPWTSLDS